MTKNEKYSEACKELHKVMDEMTSLKVKIAKEATAGMFAEDFEALEADAGKMVELIDKYGKLYTECLNLK